MAKKKEPSFWSTSANGKSSSGGSAYGQRNKRKQASGQGCAVLLIVGASVAVGIAEAARWIA